MAALSVSGKLLDKSGSITLGGAAQTAAAVNTDRRYLLIQNKTTATESFWVSLDATATADSPSIEFPPGLTLTWEASFVPSGAISVIATTTGTKFTVKESGS